MTVNKVFCWLDELVYGVILVKAQDLFPRLYFDQGFAYRKGEGDGKV